MVIFLNAIYSVFILSAEGVYLHLLPLKISNQVVFSKIDLEPVRTEVVNKINIINSPC